MKIHPAVVSVSPFHAVSPINSESVNHDPTLGRILCFGSGLLANQPVVDYLTIYQLSDYDSYASAETSRNDEPLFTRGKWKRVVEHKTFGPGTPLHRKTLDNGLAVVVVQYGDIERTFAIDQAYWITPIEAILRVKTLKAKEFKFRGSPEKMDATNSILINGVNYTGSRPATWSIPRYFTKFIVASNLYPGPRYEPACLRRVEPRFNQVTPEDVDWCEKQPPLRKLTILKKKVNDVWCSKCEAYAEQFSHDGCTAVSALEREQDLRTRQYRATTQGLLNARSVYRAYVERREQNRLYRVAASKCWPSFRALCSELWNNSLDTISKESSRVRVACEQWASAVVCEKGEVTSHCTSQKQFEYELFNPNNLLTPEAAVAISDSMQEDEGNSINTFGMVSSDFDGEADHCIKDRRNDAIWFSRRTRPERYTGHMKLVCERCGIAFFNRKGTKHCGLENCETKAKEMICH